MIYIIFLQGGVIAMSTFYPLDTARYRLQVEHPDHRKATSTLKLLRQLVAEEGFSTLYRGMKHRLGNVFT